MEIQIITKKVRGKFLRNLLPAPTIFKGNLSHWVLQININNITGQEMVNYTWMLSYGQNFPKVMSGGTRVLEIQPEQSLTWSFIPSQSGEQRLEFWIRGLDPELDIVLDDYGTRLRFENNGVVCYSWVFEVERFREIILFWFAIIATIGAIAEILNLLLTYVFLLPPVQHRSKEHLLV